MPCTTLLAGKKATFDGSTMIARNEDSGVMDYWPKKYLVISPAEQPKVYKNISGKFSLELPGNPMRYTAMQAADRDRRGLWAAAGVNEAHVSMTATETLTSNERVISGDPLVEEGIGEEDIVTIVLPYIRSAREGVARLGTLLKTYGTYEKNGIAFSDRDEVWWLETIGGHHWIARRIPDDCFAIASNCFNIDDFDLEDAFGSQKEYMCSPDLESFINANHLDLSLDGRFNARTAFGSYTDKDRFYNTPRCWYVGKVFSAKQYRWDGPGADFMPGSGDIPFCMKPDRKLTVEDFKYVLSSHYQNTIYDPCSAHSDPLHRGELRPIGIDRNNFLSLTQIRPDKPLDSAVLEWHAFGSNVFNAFIPFYANVDKSPEYFANTAMTVSTDSFYWANRLIAALADASYAKSRGHVDRYQIEVQTEGWRIIKETDARIAAESLSGDSSIRVQEDANERIASYVRRKTDELLLKVLNESSNLMKNAFPPADGYRQ